MTPVAVDVEPRMDADASLEIRQAARTVARASLWWSKTSPLGGARVGFLGDYFARDGALAQVLVAVAGRRLRSAGCTLAVGPIDGSTWNRYRFVTERGTRPPFLLEPDNPDAYPAHLRAAGFSPLARYVSAEECSSGDGDPRAARAAARLRTNGVRIRAFDPARFTAELDAMYDVATVAFAANLLFAPLDRPAFHALYAPLREHIDPDFVRIAEHDGRAVGFAFGLLDGTPSLAEGAPSLADGAPSLATCGRRLDTLIGKTQARLPDRRYAGLGAVMLDEVRRRAHERGVQRIVHALIRADSLAANASGRVADVFREYTLFARDLR